MTVFFPSYTKPSAYLAGFTFKSCSRCHQSPAPPRLPTTLGLATNSYWTVAIDFPSSSLTHQHKMFTISLTVILIRCKSYYVSLQIRNPNGFHSRVSIVFSGNGQKVNISGFVVYSLCCIFFLFVSHVLLTNI